MAGWIVSLSFPVVIYLILSGLDDVAIDLIWWWQWTFRRPTAPTPAQLDQTPERQTAIFVPLWHEHQVIEQMLSHNLATMQYSHITFFVGVYPNDALTCEAVERAVQRYANVRMARVPHPGPTSKADCLNWIYQRMLLDEEARGVTYETILTHDAEDMIHPQALRWINHSLAQGVDFVQVPVLALKTPLLAFTHGIYCDEFAELHTRDMAVRSSLQAFVPSAGVGTGYSRRALQALAEQDSNQIFIPGCLTEDYENGLRLHQLGMRQMFIPILKGVDDTFVATREYFPQHFWSSVRQRTRWVTGIALQSWERNGWRGSWKTRYWLWRDRKGLIGGPLGLVTTAMFLAALVWPPVWAEVSTPLRGLFEITTALGLYRILFRMGCVMRVYGGAMAALVPVRIFWSNWINGLATIRAMGKYTSARFHGHALSWTKTTHEYPSRAALLSQALRLGEILVQNRIVTREAVEQAETSRGLVPGPRQRLGEQLVRLGAITEQQLYEALGLQQQLPLVTPEPLSIPRRVARALPTRFIREWKVIPFAIDELGVQLCTPEAPSAELTALLRRHTGLAVRFHLISPSRFEVLAAAVLESSAVGKSLGLAAGA